jgi:hypothetical protein
MTTLVGILCGDKSFKRVYSRALLLVIICFYFLYSSATIFAGDLGGPFNGPGPVPNAPAPGGPFNGPGPVPNGTIGGPGGGGGAGAQPGAGGATGGVDDFRQSPEEAAAQAAALAASEGMGSTPDGVLGFFHTYVLTGIGWVVGMAGSAFDYAITNYIIGFGSLYITGTGETIDELWSTVRDIFNLTFIFGLVYIGFKMILDSSDSSARKMLVSLIGAALLVNFSLFITKFVVDFSNIAAAQIFNAFDGSGSGPLSITNGFMTMMGIQSLIGVEYTAGGSFAYIIGMLLIFAILAYVFLAGAVMIIIRFVVLNIYMVFSPFMFLGWVFPALQSYSRDYWSGFLRQAFFAPAFLFMLYLSYRVASTFPTQRDLGHMFNPNGSSVVDAPALIPYFALVIVFLCASMVVAKKMGAHGATASVSFGKNLAGRAGRGLKNAATYIPRAGGRMAVNAAGEAATKRLNNLQAGTGAMSWLARRNGVDRLARGAAESATNAKFGTSGSNKDQKAYAAGIRARTSQTNAERRRAEAITNAENAFEDTTTGAVALNTELANLATAIRDMTGDEIKDLGIAKLSQSQYAVNLSDAQIDNLEKTGAYNPAQIQGIRNARNQGFQNIAAVGHSFGATPPAALRANVGNAIYNGTVMHQQRSNLASRSVQEIGRMPINMFTNLAMAEYITPTMLAERMRNGIPRTTTTGQDIDGVRTTMQTYYGGLAPGSREERMWANWTNTTDRGAELGLLVRP